MSDTGTGSQSAYDIIAQSLRDYGLEDVADFVRAMVFDEGITDFQNVLARLRQDQGSAGDFYRQRFRANQTRLSAGLSALSEQEYIATERALLNTMRDMDMPEGFYDSPDDVAQFIGVDVSAEELATRIEDGYRAVSEANPETVDAMRRLYGIEENELASYFLDPERAYTTLTRRATAARIAGEAQAQAEFTLTAEQAEALQREGIQGQQARAGFAAIEQLQEVFQPTTGEREQTFTEQEQIGAMFGTDPRAAQRLRQRQRRRQAEFEAGGRFATGQQGEVTGLR